MIKYVLGLLCPLFVLCLGVTLFTHAHLVAGAVTVVAAFALQLICNRLITGVWL
jgi:hypothetical protein